MNKIAIKTEKNANKTDFKRDQMQAKIDTKEEKNNTHVVVKHERRSDISTKAAPKHDTAEYLQIMKEKQQFISSITALKAEQQKLFKESKQKENELRTAQSKLKLLRL